MIQEKENGSLCRVDEWTLESHRYDDRGGIMEQFPPTETLIRQGQSQPRTNPREQLQSLAAFTPSVENSRNVAHHHSAAQDTSLAYVQTSLGCAAAGVVLVRFISMTPASILFSSSLLGKAASAVIEVLGVGILITGIYRYLIKKREVIEKICALTSAIVWLIVYAMVIITLITFGLITFGWVMLSFALDMHQIPNFGFFLMIAISIMFGLMPAIALN